MVRRREGKKKTRGSEVNLYYLKKTADPCKKRRQPISISSPGYG